MSDLVVSLVTVLLSGALSFFVAKSTARSQVVFQRRLDAFGDLEHRIREVADTFSKWASKVALSDDTPDNLYAEGAKIHHEAQELISYYRTKERYLEPRTRELIKPIVYGLHGKSMTIVNALGNTPDTELAGKEAAWAIDDTASEGSLLTLQAELERESDKITGAAPPHKRALEKVRKGRDST